MHTTLRNLLPALALALAACELSAKNLGDPNVDSDSASASDSDTDAATGSASATEGHTSAGTQSTAGPLTEGPMTSAADTDMPGTTGTSESSGTGHSMEEESATAESTGEPAACEEAPLQAPGVDKSCQSDDDCAVVFHQTDCCGTVAAFAVNLDSVDAYNEAEAPCMYEPICDCVPMATVAEDGDETADIPSIVAVCRDNQCRSEVP